jgi:hypothetical protein
MRAEREREMVREKEEDRRRREWLKRRLLEVCVRERKKRREATGLTGKEENAILVISGGVEYPALCFGNPCD